MRTSCGAMMCACVSLPARRISLFKCRLCICCDSPFPACSYTFTARCFFVAESSRWTVAKTPRPTMVPAASILPDDGRRAVDGTMGRPDCRTDDHGSDETTLGNGHARVRTANAWEEVCRAGRLYQGGSLTPQHTHTPWAVLPRQTHTYEWYRLCHGCASLPSVHSFAAHVYMHDGACKRMHGPQTGEVTA